MKSIKVINTFGWLGTICLSLCGVPLVYQGLSGGTLSGVTWGFLSLWLAGEIFTLMFAYTLCTKHGQKPYALLINYGFNIIIIKVIIILKIFQMGVIW